MIVSGIPSAATTRRDVALLVWAAYLNTPYLWGGDDPLAGLDCSGLVLEGLKSVGLFPREGDTTAHELLHTTFGDRAKYPLLQPAQIQRGCLVFWSTDGQPRSPIRHVEIAWARVEGNEILTIGASGGGSKTVDRAAAIAQNAYVKIRRVTPGWVAALDPFGG